MGAPVHTDACLRLNQRDCDRTGCTILINRAKNESDGEGGSG